MKTTTVLLALGLFAVGGAQAYNIDGVTDEDPEFVFLDLTAEDSQSSRPEQADIAALEVRPQRTDYVLDGLFDERQ